MLEAGKRGPCSAMATGLVMHTRWFLGVAGLIVPSPCNTLGGHGFLAQDCYCG